MEDLKQKNNTNNNKKTIFSGYLNPLKSMFYSQLFRDYQIQKNKNSFIHNIKILIYNIIYITNNLLIPIVIFILINSYFNYVIWNSILIAILIISLTAKVLIKYDIIQHPNITRNTKNIKDFCMNIIDKLENINDKE